MNCDDRTPAGLTCSECDGPAEGEVTWTDDDGELHDVCNGCHERMLAGD
jgi:hypothetical protein